MKTMIYHIGQLATPEGHSARKGAEMGEIRIIPQAAVYAEDGIIRAVGSQEEVLREHPLAEMDCCIDAEQQAVIPGFVDSHTHFLFGGYREKEFLDRIQGTPYLELLHRGGGIQATVAATHTISREEMKLLGKQRMREMLVQGVTTMEGKSGYGLDMECEMKMLSVMQELKQESPMDLAVTYLGAHAVPLEYTGRSDEYVRFVVEKMLPEIRDKRLAQFCDVFCEEGVFDIEESRTILKTAKALGFSLKIHADEIECLGGAELAAELGAVSADHLLAISNQGIAALAEKDVVATLLPNTAFCLAKPYAPARKLIDGGTAVALASDYNPGSCFSNSIPLMLALAVIYMHMTMEEALTAMTLNGAAALGMADTIGSIEVGKKADLLILRYPSYEFLVYHTGVNLVKHVIKNGRMLNGGML